RIARRTPGPPRRSRLLPHRYRGIAEIDPASRAKIEIVVTIGAQAEVSRECRAARVHELVGRTFSRGHVAGEADAGDRRKLRLVLVKSERPGSARERAQSVDSVDHAPDQRGVSVELARR